MTMGQGVRGTLYLTDYPVQLNAGLNRLGADSRSGLAGVALPGSPERAGRRCSAWIPGRPGGKLILQRKRAPFR